jgi:hypothetical protein
MIQVVDIPWGNLPYPAKLMYFKLFSRETKYV